jgi:hypothetical protein
MNTRFQDLARQSGATDEHGSQATTVFCFTAQELDDFVERIVRECARASKETCNELKADASIQTPGFKPSMNLYQVTLRNRLAERFEIDGME